MSIQALLQAKLSRTAIAGKLGFSRSAINREINRSKPEFDTKANLLPVLTISDQWKQGLSCGSEDLL